MPRTLDRMDYASAARKLGARDSIGLNGGNARLERRIDGDIAYRLYSTDIIMFHPDNTATLRTGGYMTATTKRHLNVAASVSQRDYEWYIGAARFYSGMTIDLETGDEVTPRAMSLS